jgi:hypothetical protein
METVGFPINLKTINLFPNNPTLREARGQTVDKRVLLNALLYFGGLLSVFQGISILVDEISLTEA